MKKITLLVLGVLFTAFAYAQSSANEERAAVMDVGSSGTRIHIYAYQRNAAGELENLHEVMAKKISPALTHINSDQEAIDAYLDKMFADIAAEPMPVWFFATGGMRFLSAAQQKTYYDNISQWFANHPNWQLKSARTISGKEEALFGWYSVNYQLNKFSALNEEPVAVLDVGGASTQIAMPVENLDHVPTRDIVHVSINNRHYNVFVHSFLGLGQNEFTHHYMDNIYCYPKGYKLPSGNLAHGNARECVHKTINLVNGVHEVARVVSSVIYNNKVAHWYLIGGLSSTLTSEVYQGFENSFEPQKLLEKADSRVCGRSWEILKSKYANNAYLYNYCLLPSAYYSLFVYGYGISQYRTIHLLPKEKSADWTIGVILREKSKP